MESSSYSKTRSPARFLAAFLAFVMLFIFMPVLPVGAETIKSFSIKYDNVNVWATTTNNVYLENEQLPEQNGTLGGLSYKTKNSSGDDDIGYTVTFTFDADQKKLGSPVFLVHTGSTSEVNVKITADGVVSSQVYSDGATVTIPAADIKNANSFDIELTEKQADPVVTVNGYTTNSNFYVEGWGRTSSGSFAETVSKGEDFIFTIQKYEGYEFPVVKKGNSLEDAIEVVGGDPISDNMRRYTISDIDENVFVKIDAAAKAQYAVTYIPDPAYTLQKKGDIAFASGDKFDYNSKVEFKVNVSTGYSDANMTVSANGVTLAKGDDGYYSFTIKADTTISINGVTKEQYVVTVASGVGFTVAPTRQTVSYNDSAIFDITIATGYQVKDLKIKNDGSELSKESEYTTTQSGSTITVTIKNVTSTMRLTVEGIAPIEYTVKLPESQQGYTVKFSGDGDQASRQVQHGKSINFTVTVDNGYKLGSVMAKYSEDGEDHFLTLTSSGNNTYTIPNITTGYDVQVTVTTIDITVTFRSVKSTKIDGEPFGGITKTVKYNIEDNHNGAFLADGTDCTLDLTKIKPTRTGWDFENWVLGSGVEIEKLYARGDSATFDVSATWEPSKIESVFCTLGASIRHDGGRDIIECWCNTNVAEGDEDAKVSVVAYGVLYSNGEIKNGSYNANDLAGRAVGEWTSAADGAVCWTFAGNGSNIYAKNEKYTVKAKHVKDESAQCERKAVAWVVLSYNDQYYLFMS